MLVKVRKKEVILLKQGTMSFVNGSCNCVHLHLNIKVKISAIKNKINKM